MTLDETETSVSYTMGDALVYIYSAVPKHLRRMRGDDRFRETRSATPADIEAEGDWAMFEIDRKHYDPLGGVKRRPLELSDEQRAVLSARAKQNLSKKPQRVTESV